VEESCPPENSTSAEGASVAGAAFLDMAKDRTGEDGRGLYHGATKCRNLAERENLGPRP
jgi:hypothetical protein